MKKTIRINIKAGLYYCFWVLLLVGKGLGYTSYDSAYRYMTWIAIAFIGGKLLLTNWGGGKELFITIGLNILGIANFAASKSPTALLTILAITGARNIDLAKLLKISFWIRGGMFLVRTFLATQGMLDAQLMYRYDKGMVIARYGLGYGQPNATHYMLFTILVLCILVYGKKLRFIHFAGLMVYNLHIYNYTLSRSGMLISAFLLIMCFLANRRNRLAALCRSGLSVMSRWIFPVVAVLSFVICYLFAKVSWLKSFGSFSSRFATANRVILDNSMTFLGIPDITTDFAMINFFYCDGILLFVLFVAGYYYLLKRFKDQKYINLQLVCICYAIYSLSESYTDSVLMNVSLLFMVYLIYRQKPPSSWET